MIKENDTYLEEEIDLRELFKIIWDRKVFIIVFTLVVTIIAGLYTYLKIPIFEVKSYVELGYINKEKIEDIDSLEQKLKVIFSVEDMKFEKDSFEKGIVTSIKQVKAVKNFLEIKTEALSNEAATAKNKEVLKFIQELSSEKIKEHEILFENTILNTQREIDFINNIEMKNISSQIEILKEQEIKSISVMPLTTSTTNIIMSASSIAMATWRLISSSKISSELTTQPPVSTTEKSRPFHSHKPY